MDDKNKKIDYKTLNEVLKSSNFLLKIFLTMSILAVLILVIYLFDRTSLLITIGHVLGILSPLFIGVVVAWLLEPGINYFVKNKVNRRLSACVVYLILIFLVTLILALIVPEFIAQLNELIKKVPYFLTSINNFITDLFQNFSSTELDLTKMKDNLIGGITNYVNNLNLTGVVDTLSSSIKIGVDIFLGLLIAFYLSLDFSKVSKNFNFLIPGKYQTEFKKIGKMLNEMLRSYVNGTLLSCLFVMILSLIGFLISGVSSPLLFAIFCAITNIIPYFGPYIGGIPVIIVGFAISPFTGIACLITIILVQFLEGNILHPLIVGKAISLHPITMMLSLLVFEYFFGILGMIIAAPVVATLKIILIYLNDKYHFLNKLKLN
ncbi:MAG: AI-2E family transporter [Bacilli bacterium]|nr:AI-2E family transporter [Bacilli bacterium]